MSGFSRQCCTQFPTRPDSADGSGTSVAAKAPEPIIWLADTTFGKIRLDSQYLKYGAKDAGPVGPVRLLQQGLLYWGSQLRSPPTKFMPVYGADGQFGNETKAAVKDFQKQNKNAAGATLVDDGIVGRKTMAALDAIMIPDPKPKPVPDSMLKAVVDVVIFPDGIQRSHLGTFLREANYVYNRAGIEVVLGTVWEPNKTADKACEIFEINRRDDHKGKCSSVVTRKSINEDSDEIKRLAKFRPTGPRRVTLYLVGPFPTNNYTSAGLSFTPRSASGLGFSILIANGSSRYDPRDTFWHEFGHCLLNTGPDDVVDGKSRDHSHEFMGLGAMGPLGYASRTIPPAVKKRMQDTVFLDLI